jgi:hypothetical protein
VKRSRGFESPPIDRCALSQFEMTFGHVRALARTIQGRLGGCFCEQVDRVKSDSAHQRVTEGAVQVGADDAATEKEAARIFSRAASLPVDSLV